jgi:CRP-like cAMP-binding protein
MSLLTGEPRNATVVATVSSVVFEITKADLEPVLQRNPDLAAGLAAVVARRLEERQRAAGRTDEEIRSETVSRSQKLLGRIRTYFGLQPDGEPSSDGSRPARPHLSPVKSAK